MMAGHRLRTLARLPNESVGTRGSSFSREPIISDCRRPIRRGIGLSLASSSPAVARPIRGQVESGHFWIETENESWGASCVSMTFDMRVVEFLTGWGRGGLNRAEPTLF